MKDSDDDELSDIQVQRMDNAVDPSVTDVMSPPLGDLGPGSQPNQQLSSEEDSCFAKKVAIEHKKTILFNKLLKKAVKLNIDTVDQDSSSSLKSSPEDKSKQVGSKDWISPNQL